MLALLAVVVLAAAGPAAAQGTAAEAGLPAIPALDQAQQEVEVSAFPLTQLPGCNFTAGDNYELPIGALRCMPTAYVRASAVYGLIVVQSSKYIDEESA
jgi:hypothetical protein